MKVPVFGNGSIIGSTNYEAVPVIYAKPGSALEENPKGINWNYVQNIVIRNLSTGKEDLILEKPAYVADFDCNYWYYGRFELPERKMETHFYFGAADEDTNHDGKLDDDDDGHAYAYRLADGKISRVDPRGTSLVSLKRPGRGNILELEVVRWAVGGKATYERWDFDEQNPDKIWQVGGADTVEKLEAIWRREK